MAHPFLNRESKTTLRWYANPNLLLRNQSKCKPANGTTYCPYRLIFPHRTLPPFQIRATAGASVVTSWVINDMNGTLFLDMAANISDLTFTNLANPPRTVIMLEEALVIQELIEGAYEMVITTDQGMYYSESFEVVCAGPSSLMDNSDLSSGLTNWNFNGYRGLFTTTGFSGAGEPLVDGTFDGQQKGNLTDNLLYTWDGEHWVSSTPDEGSYWTTGAGGTWYRFTGGSWVGLVTPPVQTFGDSTCYTGAENVPWVYTPPASTLPTYVLITFSIFKGVPFAGSVELYVGGVLIDTYTENTSGELFIYLEAGDTINFLPADRFNGCIQNTAFNATTDGTECLYELNWRNCGDLGTVLYEGNEFRNFLYLKETEADISNPTPIFKLEPEEDADGGDVQIRSRKDVDWTLGIAGIPWYVLDALSEAVNCDDVRLKVPYGEGEDSITDLRFDVAYEAAPCLPKVSMTFRVDEAVIGEQCCGTLDLMCGGDGYARFTLEEGGADEFYLNGPSGYFSVKHPDGTVTTHIAGVIALTQEGDYCAWGSDRLGNMSNDVNVFYLSFSQATDIDISDLTRVEDVTATDNPLLTCIDNEGCDRLFGVLATGCAFTEACVDEMFNNINAALDDISINFQDGTSAAPTAASATNRTAITANGGSILTN